MKVTELLFSGVVLFVISLHVLVCDDVAAFECVANHSDLTQGKTRKDIDVFAMWEKGVPAEEVYRAVAEDGVFSAVEVLTAADVVLELKDLIAREQAGNNDPKVLAKLRSELKNFDAIFRRILMKSK